MGVAEIEAWLASKGVSFWADWNINDPERRYLAALWFAKQIGDFQAWQTTVTNQGPNWDVV